MKTKLELSKANPFIAAENGAEVTYFGATLGTFDKVSCEALILRGSDGVELVRADGWIDFLAVCDRFAQSA